MLKIQIQEKEMIEFLKANGYEVSYLHKMPGSPQTTGYCNIDKGKECGLTVGCLYNLNEINAWRQAGRTTDKPKAIMECVAYCSAYDQFDKKKGRIIALARLMKKLGVTKKFKMARVK